MQVSVRAWIEQQVFGHSPSHCLNLVVIVLLICHEQSPLSPIPTPVFIVSRKQATQWELLPRGPLCRDRSLNFNWAVKFILNWLLLFDRWLPFEHLLQVPIWCIWVVEVEFMGQMKLIKVAFLRTEVDSARLRCIPIDYRTTVDRGSVGVASVKFWRRSIVAILVLYLLLLRRHWLLVFGVHGRFLLHSGFLINITTLVTMFLRLILQRVIVFSLAGKVLTRRIFCLITCHGLESRWILLFIQSSCYY